MSSDRSNTAAGRPLKPTLASNRPSRTPLTPRVSATSTPTLRAAGPKLGGTGNLEPRLTPRVKQTEDSPATAGSGNVTPRSQARRSRVGVGGDGSQTPPAGSEDTPVAARTRSAVGTSAASNERTINSSAGFGGLYAEPTQAAMRPGRPKSTISSGGGSQRAKSPLANTPSIYATGSSSIDESIESRFFHASDAKKQESAPPKRPETKKTPSFFYADGHQEDKPGSTRSTASSGHSPMMELRPPVPWLRTESPAHMSKSPPILSPALSSVSNTSSFFPAQTVARSPSPSKENIHLSYRKGASQIFGTRPLSRPALSTNDVCPIFEESQDSLEPALPSTGHKKSPSLSSIDSGNSHSSRRRSATQAETYQSPSPLHQEVKSAFSPRLSSPPKELPTIDTSLEAQFPPLEGALSPTKTIADFAADARRERKVLDLEISNSSLLAINSSLEREVRRQKTELKRFRRLSRAGRFSSGPTERSARFSEGLSTLGELDDEDELDEFGTLVRSTDNLFDGSSDDEEDEDESVTSGDHSSPSALSSRGNERLAKDEKRLRVDLAKHKDLLVQSQMMNQTIKRCMYATEEMINEAKKALQYHVRVSDVKLGGRVLNDGHEDEDIEINDLHNEPSPDSVQHEDENAPNDDMESAHGLLQVWQGVGRPSFESSEGGDRDSGIEVDKRDSGSRVFPELWLYSHLYPFFVCSLYTIPDPDSDLYDYQLVRSALQLSRVSRKYPVAIKSYIRCTMERFYPRLSSTLSAKSRWRLEEAESTSWRHMGVSSDLSQVLELVPDTCFSRPVLLYVQPLYQLRQTECLLYQTVIV
nr:hypothetical protein CFP56_71710 [Quercus suber]